MDPLSLTASIIAIIGVGGSLAKTIRKLASAQQAPRLAMALSNELSDLCLIVTVVQKVLETQQPIEDSFNASIASSLTEAHEKAMELRTVHDDLVSTTSKTKGLRPFSKIRGVWDPKKIRKIQQDLRSVRLKLVGSLGVLNSYVNFVVSVAFSTLSASGDAM